MVCDVPCFNAYGRPPHPEGYDFTSADDVELKGGAIIEKKYLRLLMSEILPTYFDRVPAQHLIVGDEGSRYERIAATQGAGWAAFYDYSGRPFEADLPSSGSSSNRCSFSSVDGTLKKTSSLAPEPGQDRAFVATPHSLPDSCPKLRP